jgi:hypothetical protein
MKRRFSFHVFVTVLAGFAALAVAADSTKSQAPPCALTSGTPVAIDPDQVAKRAATFTKIDGPLVAPSTGHSCTSNSCQSTGGCATCQTMTIYLPLTAQVTAVRCYTNANYPNDSPSMYQIQCGQDVAWSYFSWPVQSTTPSNTVITASYFNRSNNRSRTVELQVDYN